MRIAFALMGSVVLTGCFASKSSVRENTARAEILEKQRVEDQKLIYEVRNEIYATRTRLEQALRASADQGTEVLSEKLRINAALGKSDENAFNIDQVRRELASTRADLDKRLDEIKRAQEASKTAVPPPVSIPNDREQHFAAIESALLSRDYTLTRTLAREYSTRYPADDKNDDVAYLKGDADLKDGRPASALGEFNRVLKSTPPSNVLDKAIFGMGEAYLLMHDCVNAKDAFKLVVKKYPRDVLARESEKRIAGIDRPAPGVCQ